MNTPFWTKAESVVQKLSFVDWRQYLLYHFLNKPFNNSGYTQWSFKQKSALQYIPGVPLLHRVGTVFSYLLATNVKMHFTTKSDTTHGIKKGLQKQAFEDLFSLILSTSPHEEVLVILVLHDVFIDNPVD